MLVLFVAVPDDDDDEVSLLDSCRHSLGASLLQSLALDSCTFCACSVSVITFLWWDFLCSLRSELCVPGLPAVGIQSGMVLPCEQSWCTPPCRTALELRSWVLIGADGCCILCSFVHSCCPLIVEYGDYSVPQLLRHTVVLLNRPEQSMPSTALLLPLLAIDQPLQGHPEQKRTAAALPCCVVDGHSR